MELINGLLVHWKLVDHSEYLYRFSGRVEAVPMLDLNAMNYGFITMESLWLTMKFLEEPLCHIKSEKCEMYAVMTQRAFLDVLTILANKSNQSDGDLGELTEFMKMKSKSL